MLAFTEATAEGLLPAATGSTTLSRPKRKG